MCSETRPVVSEISTTISSKSGVNTVDPFIVESLEISIEGTIYNAATDSYLMTLSTIPTTGYLLKRISVEVTWSDGNTFDITDEVEYVTQLFNANNLEETLRSGKGALEARFMSCGKLELALENISFLRKAKLVYSVFYNENELMIPT